MEELWGFPIVGLTAPTLLGIAILLILRGSLVPRRTYDDIVKDRDQWREAHKLSEEARSIQTQQLNELLEVGETVKAVLNAINSARSSGGEP